MVERLGTMLVGETGLREFGSFRLSWTVKIDHIAWELRDEGQYARKGEPPLQGALKYVGWNRMSIPTMPNGADEFEVYQHQWPHVRAALDCLYDELLPQIAANTYAKATL